MIDPGLREMYELHDDIILAPHIKGTLVNKYNFPTNNAISVADLMGYLNLIFEEQDNDFCFILSLGVVLKNVEDDTYRFFAPAHNAYVLPHPFYITTPGKI